MEFAFIYRIDRTNSEGVLIFKFASHVLNVICSKIFHPIDFHFLKIAYPIFLYT